MNHLLAVISLITLVSCQTAKPPPWEPEPQPSAERVSQAQARLSRMLVVSNTWNLLDLSRAAFWLASLEQAGGKLIGIAVLEDDSSVLVHNNVFAGNYKIFTNNLAHGITLAYIEASTPTIVRTYNPRTVP